jgi:hypothetical protein
MQEASQVLVLPTHSIYISEDDEYRFESSDNSYNYRAVYLNGGDITSKVGVQVFEGKKLISDCLIGAAGGATGVYANSTLISNGGLVICCSDSVFKLSIPDLKLEWVTKADMATCFEIFYLDEDYIVHGELQITRLDKNGNIVWQQSGRDIFTTLDGIDTFQVTDELIIAKDFQNYTYKFDYNGNIVE